MLQLVANVLLGCSGLMLGCRVLTLPNLWLRYDIPNWYIVIPIL